MSNIPRKFIYHKKPSPCKDCQKRFVGCHSSCEDFAKWKTEEFDEKKKVFKEWRKQNDAEEYKIKLHQIRKERGVRK